jgi:hypothetical protein
MSEIHEPCSEDECPCYLAGIAAVHQDFSDLVFDANELATKLAARVEEMPTLVPRQL